MQVKTIKTTWPGGGIVHNTYIVEGKRSSIVIDAGCPLKTAQENTSLPISAVLLTHCHIDHTNFVEEYDKDKIIICGSKKTQKLLTDKIQNLTTLFNNPKEFNVKNYAFINDGDKVILNDFEITALSTPGHTEDGTSYVVSDGKQKIVFVGDTVFETSIGSLSFDTSSENDLIGSLKKLDKLDYAIMYSGHGNPSTKEIQTNNIKYWLEILQQEFHKS